MSDADLHKNQPNANDPAVQAKLFGLRKRMIKDLATHLPDDWIQNANAKDRVEFLQHMATSRTMAEIVEIVSWTALCVEHEEEMRARPKE